MFGIHTAGQHTSLPEFQSHLKAFFLSHDKSVHMSKLDFYLLQPNFLAIWPMQVHVCMMHVLAVTVCLERFVCKHGLTAASFDIVLVVPDHAQCVECKPGGVQGLGWHGGHQAHRQVHSALTC